jgi:MFS family permease
MNQTTVYSKEKSRLAVMAFYLAEGLCFASWASRIPDIKEFFSVDYALYWGMVLFLIPVGKFVAIPLAGWLVSRFGSRSIMQLSVLGYGAALLAIGFSTSIYILGFCLFCFGVFWNLCDISLNTQGIGIERLYGRTIMAIFHGTWSLAACFGALIGFVMMNLGEQPWFHFSVVACIVVLLVLLGRRYLIDDATPEAKEEISEGQEKQEKPLMSFVRHPEILLLQLGLCGLFALIVESAMFDWSGVYFKEQLNVPDTLQIGFLIFMVMMACGRFLANWAYGKLGKQRVLQVAGSFIFAGFFICALLGNLFDSMALKVAINSIGFMLVGLGISCMVPTIYSFVAAKSHTPVGIALTILSSISFIGSLIAPLLIGAVASAFSLSKAYIVIGLLGLAILLMTTFCSAFKNDAKQ